VRNASINGIPSRVVSIHADSLLTVRKITTNDTSLYCIVDDQNETAESLNSDLNSLSTWASDWCVNFNASKTKPMLFTRKHDVNIPPLYMNDDVLEDVLKHKHLGIHFCLMAPGNII
jgi:hypothetical protein